MKIAVTGSTGFVGQNLIKYLDGFYDLIILDRLQLKNPELIDLTDSDVIVHLAGKAHDLHQITDPNQYYEVNYELTKKLFNLFLESRVSVFVFVSSVKAVADEVSGVLTEDHNPEPLTHYGISKRQAEEYLLSKVLPSTKRLYILRPCMIHGPHNKGNLNLLYNYCRRFSFWPLGAYDNRRSFCSIFNLCFIIDQFVQRKDIPSGIYNVADDKPISTNHLINLIGEKFNKNIHLVNIPKSYFRLMLNLASLLGFSSAKVRFQKLTENFIVSNSKVKLALGKELPISADEGIKKTLESFES